MAKKRAFSKADIELKSEDYHGSCYYARTRPDLAEKNVNSVNVELTFDRKCLVDGG